MRGLSWFLVTLCLSPCNAVGQRESEQEFHFCVQVLDRNVHEGTVSPAQNSTSSPDYHPLVEVQKEDFGDARKHFKTNILRAGPPPAEWDDLITPPGAHEITYTSGTLHLRAWISTAPSLDTTKHPAVLFLHSGFDLDAESWSVTRPFRDAGFIVMTPTVRGENGQHGIFTMYYDEVDDVIQAAEFLRSQMSVDSKRIFVAGHSVGGTLTLLAAELYPHFAGAASISGSPDQALYLKYAKGASRNAPFDLDDPQEVQLRSPLAYAASMKCPVRLFYGTDEAYYVFTAPRTAEIARGKSIDAQAIAVEGDHGSNEPKSIKLALEFFQQQMR
jgi:dipeptidyl aminopeptidase/acylaminoacyl peptidase